MSRDQFGNYIADVESLSDTQVPGVGGDGGGDEPITKNLFETPSLPFSYEAPSRTLVEIYWTAEGTSDAGRIQASRTGAPDMVLCSIAGGDQEEGVSTLRMEPGDVLTLTDVSTGAAASVALLKVVAWEE